MRQGHQTVLVKEAVAALQLQPEGVYVDATFGRGGHSLAIRAALGSGGKLLIIDRDPEAIACAKQLFGSDPQVFMHQGSFGDLAQIIAALGWPSIDGVLCDLGVSSPQLDDAERGFSFQKDGPLDMRMDFTKGESAASWLARAEESEIAWVLKTYGEEKAAKRLARALVRARVTMPFTRTLQLANFLSGYLKKEKKKHPATRSFQAIRIHINQELQALESILESSLKVLVGGGHMVFMSFHSLEDRMVKQFFKRHETIFVPRGLPLQEKDMPRGLLKVFKKCVASNAEKAYNPRARSAVLRVAQKVVGQ